jgi:pyrroline-5-carboxylate reductase
MIDQSLIGFIGGGNMGEALIKGLLAAALFSPDRIIVSDADPARLEYLQRTYGIRPGRDIGEVCAASRIVILAVKPQVLPSVLEKLRPLIPHKPLVISIAAGISLATLAGALPEGTPVIRVMPNTPALVQQGASALSRSQSVTDEQMQQAMEIFGAVGSTLEVDEKGMDAVTGLSGSGPAYTLLFLESMIDAGVLMGLPRQVSRQLVLQTVQGTVQMVRETGKHPAELKDQITSPGGTTIRGLMVLEERAFHGAVMRAVEAATLRSKELGES